MFYVRSIAAIFLILVLPLAIFALFFLDVVPQAKIHAAEAKRTVTVHLKPSLTTAEVRAAIAAIRTLRDAHPAIAGVSAGDGAPPLCARPGQ